MYRNELYKIFTKKSIYVVLFFIILIMVYVISARETMKEDIYLELYETWGGPITEEKVSLADEKLRVEDQEIEEQHSPDALDESVESEVYFPPLLSVKEWAVGNVYFSVAAAGLQSGELQERKETLQGKMNKLSGQSYEYKKVAKELSMLDNLDNPYGFYLIRAWNGMIDLIDPSISVIFLTSLIFIGLTSVFADEHTKRTAELILVTKHGKKRIVTAKIMAGLTYIIVIFTLIHIINVFIQWKTFGGFHGWDAPMQNLLDGIYGGSAYEQSPYAWEVWQFYGITLSIQFLACVALAILVLFISMLVKNAMIAFFVSGAVIGVPIVLKQIGLENGIFQYIHSFSYSKLISAGQLFQEFNVYNIFGYPMLYPHLLLIIFTILTTIFMILIYNRYRQTEISH